MFSLLSHAKDSTNHSYQEGDYYTVDKTDKELPSLRTGYKWIYSHTSEPPFTGDVFIVSKVSAPQKPLVEKEIFCENGSFEEMGDRHWSLIIKSDGITFQLYELGYSITSDDIQLDGNTFSSINTKVTEYSEGMEMTAVKTFIAKLNEEANELHLTLSSDYESPFITETFSCSPHN